MKAKINDFQMYFEDLGKGVPVIFIHGMGGNTKEWSSIIPELSKEVRCIVVDLRGHGQSDKLDQSYTMSLFAKDVATLLDHLGIQSAYFCGFSMGGYVVLRAALIYPEKVRGLFLVDSAPNIPEYTVKVAGVWAEILLSKGLEAFLEAQVEDSFHPMFRRRHKSIVDVFRESKRASSSETETPGLIHKGSETEPIDFRKRLKEIKAPTLIIHAEDDRIVPVELAEFLHNQIPNSELAIFPSCGHQLIIERPQFFIDLLSYFIEKTEKTRQKSK